MSNKTPIKILYLITKSNFGGAQKYVFELAKEAKDAGFDVSVACGGAGSAGAPTGQLVEKLQSEDIRFSIIKNFLRDMSPLHDVSTFFEILKLLITEKPDVLHVTSSKAGGIGALAGRLTGTKKIIFTSHGLTFDEVWRPLWQRTLIYMGTWFTILLSHHSIMISTETFNRAVSMPFLDSRISLIKNGIAIYTLLDKTSARTTLAPTVPQKTIWIGGIGELHKNKNWAVAIQAMTSLPKGTHLLIVGEGEERNKLEELIKKENLEERVHLLGFVEAAPYLKALDIFILPSIKEGLPYVLLEAGLAELPTIASDLPGNKDIIETGKNGFLVEPTPKLIATVVEMLIRDESMRRELGQNLHQTVTEDFSIDRMVRETFSLYSSNK